MTLWKVLMGSQRSRRSMWVLNHVRQSEHVSDIACQIEISGRGNLAESGTLDGHDW